MSVFVVRTDLALEEGERIRESGVEIHGVILEEETRPETGILVTRVKIETKNGAKIMGKPIEHTLHWKPDSLETTRRSISRRWRRNFRCSCRN